MKRIMTPLFCLSATMLLVLPSCGSDESEGDTSSSGGTTSSDTGGTTSSDTGGTAGSNVGGTTDTGPNTSGAADGGTDSDANSDADAGADASGDTGTEDVCPDTQPVDGDSCPDSDLDGCEYGDYVCDCKGSLDDTWLCVPGCPDAAPATGDTCDPEAYATCAYGDQTCMCQTTDDGATYAWTCGTLATECPAEQPADGGMCDFQAIDAVAPDGCVYDGATCDCSRRSDTWSCELLCPTTQPTIGDTCSEDQESPCAYDTETCSCGTADDVTWTWTCAVPATACPDTAPADGDLCDSDALDTAAPEGCVYDDVVCDCSGRTDTFRCEIGCPAVAPATGDACVADQDSPCGYADSGQRCSCDDTALTWTCSAAAASCPETQPAEGDACLGDAIEALGDCTYGTVQCECRRGAFECAEAVEAGAGGTATAG